MSIEKLFQKSLSICHVFIIACGGILIENLLLCAPLLVLNIQQNILFALGEDLRSKLHDVNNLQENVRAETRSRGAHLEEALGVADKFARDFQDAIRALRDAQDNLVSQDSPGVDTATVAEQQRELEV